MKLILIRYGHDATELPIKDIDRIVAENDIIKIYYNSGQILRGHILKFE